MQATDESEDKSGICIIDNKIQNNIAMTTVSYFFQIFFAFCL